MGVCCGNENSGNMDTLRDLPAPDTTGIRDKYTVWEYGTPFKRTPFLAFKNAVNAAEENEGGEGYVTIQSLAAQLTTKAWAGLENEDSVICKVLLSDAFKNPKNGQSDGQIDKDYLMLYGILHCADRKIPTEKAKGLYDVLQEGGMTVHENISATDKDMKPAFSKLCSFVTTDIFNFSNVKVSFDEGEIESLEEGFEDALDDETIGWLEVVYGVKSTLPNATWMEKVTKEGKWVFDATAMRALVFKLAKVDTKHIK